jgi:hypothetical protein
MPEAYGCVALAFACKEQLVRASTFVQPRIAHLGFAEQPLKGTD